jgi:hypothetical protein
MSEELTAFLFVLVVLASICAWLYYVVRVALRHHRATHRPKVKESPTAFPVVADPVPALPISNDGPGRYRIVGVVAATGTDTKMFVEAETLANAKVKAELRGVVVTEIAKQ